MSTSDPPSRPFGMPGRPSMIARRTCSNWGRLAGSSRLRTFGTGVFASAEMPWQEAHFCMYRYCEWCVAVSPPQPVAAVSAITIAVAAANRIPRAYPSGSMDDADRTLCDLIQNDFPVVARPYAALGERLGESEEQVLRRIARLRSERIIRQISAIFDTRRLGYRSCLVAARTSAERADEAAAAINTHPGVTHNYEREHEFNIWFTVGAVSIKANGLDRTIELLGELGEVDVIRPLPALKFFKIGVDLDIQGGRDPAAKKARRELTKPTPPPEALGEREIDDIRALQTDLPAIPEPWAPLAERHGFGVEELLAQGHEFL